MHAPDGGEGAIDARRAAVGVEKTGVQCVRRATQDRAQIQAIVGTVGRQCKASGGEDSREVIEGAWMAGQVGDGGKGLSSALRVIPQGGKDDDQGDN